MAREKKDPTVQSDTTTEPSPGAHPARPVDEASDAASAKKYVEMPDDMKPDPSTIAQLEVRPDDE